MPRTQLNAVINVSTFETNRGTGAVMFTDTAAYVRIPFLPFPIVTSRQEGLRHLRYALDRGAVIHVKRVTLEAALVQ